MTGQLVEVVARRAALEAPRQMLVGREAWERRLSDPGVSLAPAQRQGWVFTCERCAREALAVMTEQEGLRLRQAARLRQLVDDPKHPGEGIRQPGAGQGNPWPSRSKAR